MQKSILKAKYTVTDVPNTDLVEIGILPRELAKLCFKMTAYGMVPYLLVFGALIVIDKYDAPKKTSSKKKNPKKTR